MIKPNSLIKLRPFKTYKDEPEKNQEFVASIRDDGSRVLYFQAIDHNRGEGRVATGFYNVAILTNQELRAGDSVTVKTILGVKFFHFKRILFITILDKNEQKAYSKAVDDFDFGEADF